MKELLKSTCTVIPTIRQCNQKRKYKQFLTYHRCSPQRILIVTGCPLRCLFVLRMKTEPADYLQSQLNVNKLQSHILNLYDVIFKYVYIQFEQLFSVILREFRVLCVQ